MSGRGAIFLSASVPELGRRGSESFDPVLIGSAVHAFIEVVLGRRLLVWGGHPAITPMIWEAARRLSVPYVESVHLYQSAFFRDRYPQMNTRFENWTEIPEVEGDMHASLEVMRRAMFRDYAFHAAVFVGGMEGVIDEFDLLRDAAPNVRLVPIPAPGGVSRELFERVGGLPDEMSTRTDFTYWLYRLLDIDPSEPRILAGGSSHAGRSPN